MSKTSKILLWTMLGIVLILVLSIALTSVLGQGQRQEVDNIEFFQIIEDAENQYGIDEIQIELYNVSAIDRDGRKVYTTFIPAAVMLVL